MADRLAAYEYELIEAAIQECGGNRRRAAAQLGISLRTLFYKRKAWLQQERQPGRPRAVRVEVPESEWLAGRIAAERALVQAPLRDDIKDLAVAIVRNAQP